jgi:superfamily II DNA or RNA helicase
MMPISWRGILAQYAGRLHRLHEQKTEATIYILRGPPARTAA